MGKIDSTYYKSPPKKYPYFDVVEGLAWSNEPKSYAGGSLATGRASHARQVKGDDPDEKGYPGPPGWGLGVGLTTPHRINNLFQNLTISHGRMRNKC